MAGGEIQFTLGTRSNDSRPACRVASVSQTDPCIDATRHYRPFETRLSGGSVTKPCRLTLLFNTWGPAFLGPR